MTSSPLFSTIDRSAVEVCMIRVTVVIMILGNELVNIMVRLEIKLRSAISFSGVIVMVLFNWKETVRVRFKKRNMIVFE